MKVEQNIAGHNGLSWYSDAHRIIYLGIPKTASTSMRHIFNLSNHPMNLNDIPDEKKGYRIFTIVRNPLNRFVSGVLESFNRLETPQRLKTLSGIRDNKEMLERYVTELEKGFCETHTAPQTFFFCPLDGISDWDFDAVLTFESLSEDFNNMCKEFEIDVELAHKHIGKKRKAEILKQVILDNPDLKDRIDKLYAEDWILYNEIQNEKND